MATKKKRARKLYGPPAKVLRFLRDECNGKTNAKYSAEICGPCYIQESQLREIVNELRRRGHPVCSSSSTGYWYAAAESDIDATITHMISRRTSINSALRGLRSAKRKMAKAATPVAVKPAIAPPVPVNSIRPSPPA